MKNFESRNENVGCTEGWKILKELIPRAYNVDVCTSFTDATNN